MLYLFYENKFFHAIQIIEGNYLVRLVLAPLKSTPKPVLFKDFFVLPFGVYYVYKFVMAL